MKKSLLFVAVAASITFAACSAMGTVAVDEHYTESCELEVATPAQFTPVKGYLDVNPVRIKETFRLSEEEITALRHDIDRIKTRASFMVLDKYNADELVSPLYDISTNPDGSYTVVVVGYTAKLVFTK